MDADIPPKTWTDERVERLKVLWAEGLSARQIADQLGGMTRNTVMGKLDRLGLLGSRPSAERDRPSAETEPRPAPPTAERRPTPASIDTLGIQAHQMRPAEGTQPPRPATPPARKADASPGNLVGIQSLGTSTCRWPVGDPQKDGFGFCGGKALAGRPYCEAHAKMAYEPPRERRRAS